MQRLMRLSWWIDRINRAIGRAMLWPLLASVFIAAGNALSRKFLSLSSNGWLEVQWHLFDIAFLGCAGYVLLVNEHVRIDVLSRRWSEKTRALVDVAALVLFALPMTGLLVVFGWTILPGGTSGMLVFVTVLVFVLGFFLDFFEIAFILVPLLAPVAEALGIDLVWFGVLLAVNLQTSFITPPLGYALFFLRGVAPAQDHADAAGGLPVKGVSTADIYRGTLPFVAVQLIVIVLLIAFPSLVNLGDARGV